MTQPSHLDVAGILTEAGVDANSADPAASVGSTTMMRSDRSQAELPVLQADGPGQVSLGELLGTGQTSAVYVGFQKTMRRKIAVRTVHPRHKTPNSPGQILSQGWMMGALEHPSIIPVYGVGRDREGNPLVLMKLVEAMTWMDVLEDPNHPLGCPKHSDPLDFNLRRMLDVFSALEHAHSRGVIHRDIKPESILIGRDGIVYLDGWNLAVSLVHDPTGRFPVASEQTQIAGTPAYMAPEQAKRDAAALAATTDVYLLGATMHDVVTGEPRHLGENVFDALYSAAASAPVDYDPDFVPPELATILNKAMAVRSADRYPNVAALRHAVEAFLRHRPSARLVKQALRTHAEFNKAIDGRQDDFIVRELFATTFTAYNSAGQFWSRSPEVAGGLQRVIREMIEYEVANGALVRARDLLSRLTSPAPDLEQAVAKARPRVVEAPTPAEPQQPVETAEARQQRVSLMAAFVVIWSGYGFAFGAIEAAGVVVTKGMLAITALTAWFVLGGFVAAYRHSLASDLVSRWVLGPFGAVAIGSAALIVTSASAVTPHELVVQHLFLFFVALAAMNALIDWRLVVGTVAYLSAYVVGSFAPQWAFWLMAGSNLVALGFSGVIIHQHITEARS